MPLSKHFRFCLWWESFFNGGHFSTCQTRKKSTPVTFFLHMRHVFLRPGVISLRRKMTPRSIFDGGRYSSLHRRRSHSQFGGWKKPSHYWRGTLKFTNCESIFKPSGSYSVSSQTSWTLFHHVHRIYQDSCYL